MEKRIRPEAHTKEETITYAKEKYGFLPLDETQRKYKSEKRCVREFYELLQERERKIEAISDEEVPMDFKMFELVIGKGHLEMVLDFRWDIFAVSYGGDRKQMRKLRRIAQDLYSYYGVTEEDITNQTERYSALVSVLSEF